MTDALDKAVNIHYPDTAVEWLHLCDGILDAAVNRYDWDIFAEYHTRLIGFIHNHKDDERNNGMLYAQLAYFDNAQPREGASKASEFQEEPPAM